MHNVKKYIAVILMGSCLAFLTGINFFIYPQSETELISYADNDSVPVPVEEERSHASSSVTINEEYLHDSHSLELSWFEKITIQKIHDAEQLQIVHYELWSPPPKLS